MKKVTKPRVKPSPRSERIEPTLRKEHILNAALQLATEVGYRGITRDAVAYVADISSALIAHYFPRMEDLKRAVLIAAIEREDLRIIAQGFVIKDPVALKISSTLKQKVLDQLAS